MPKGEDPSLQQYDKEGRMFAAEYDEKTYKKIIDSFLATVPSKFDVRFMFIITPEISIFLDKIVKKEKTPKAVYIRKLIEEDMREKNFI